MKTIDQYLFAKILTNLFVILAILTSILTLFSFFRITSISSINGSTFSHLVILSISYVPSYISSIFPLIIAGVIFFSYMQLKNKKHLVILKSIGLSPLDIMRCSLMFAAFAFIIHLFLTMFLSPYCMRVQQMARSMISLENILQSQKTPKEFQGLSKNITLYFDSIKSDGTLINIFYNNSAQHSIITAEKGIISGKKLFLYHGTKFQYTNPSNSVTFQIASVNLHQAEGKAFEYYDWKYFERYFPSLISPKYTRRSLPPFYAQASFMILSPLLSLCLIPMVALFVISMPEERHSRIEAFILPTISILASFIFFMTMYIKMQKTTSYLFGGIFFISSITPLFITFFYYLFLQKKYK